MARANYAISWLYGEFRVARFIKGELDAQWASEELVNTQAGLIRALDEACNHMDLTVKGDVTVVHEHDLHTHDYLEVPTMKKRDLEKYLARKVEQNKNFEEDAAWCYHQVRHQGGKEGVLLHQLPRNIVDSTVAACTAAGLAPKRYVPLTEIVSDYIPTTDIEPSQMVIVLACFDQRVEIILALGDGEALFVRELNYGATADMVERLVTDVNRTVRYTKQQVGRSVDVAWVMGHPEWQVVEGLREGVEVPVEFDADASDPNFWSLWATRLSGKLSANFISAFEQKNINVEMFRRVGVYTTAAVIVLSALMTVLSSALVAHRNDQMEEIMQRSDAVRTTIDSKEMMLAELVTQQGHLDRLRATSQNLPSLLMLHLSRLVPEDVTLTSVSVNQSPDGWHVEMQGRVHGYMRHGARVLAGFENRISGPPWQIHVHQSFKSTWMEQFSQGKMGSAAEAGFFIAGSLQ
ncbi:MAG: hypothetical protein GKR90_15415 [Pseudomonadales bacterium]|nr:hypothetical protein [Pseudomonadales bacterium]